MGDYRSLRVWQAAHEVVLRVYRCTGSYPVGERYGLTSQTRRAAVSIATNLAEGCGRNSDAELARYCRIALGSANELDYQLLLGRDLGLLPPAEFAQLSSETVRLRRMLSALADRVSSSVGS